jgi:hypothetical protein
MGTRHNIRVKIDGQIKVRQYGQWDGYPTGQGIGIAEFLHKEMDKDKFKDALRKCRFMTDKECETFDKEHSGTSWRNSHPWLSRDAGSTILKMIQDNDDEDDTTWCEYLYLIDMDAETVSVQGLRYHKEDLTLPFSEWTVEAMKRLEQDQAA